MDTLAFGDRPQFKLFPLVLSLRISQNLSRDATEAARSKTPFKLSNGRDVKPACCNGKVEVFSRHSNQQQFMSDSARIDVAYRHLREQFGCDRGSKKVKVVVGS
jgi:hypothetical protein